MKLYSLVIVVIVTLFSLISNVFGQSSDNNDNLLIINTFNYLEGQCQNGVPSDLTCPAAGINGNMIIKLDSCITFNFNFVKFELTPEDQQINKTVYNAFDENCTGPIVSSTIYQQGECIIDCANQNINAPLMFSVSNSDMVVIPPNSWVDVSYVGNCSGIWKDDFVMIESYSLGVCINQTPTSSVKYINNPNLNSITIQSSSGLNCNPPFSSSNLNMGNICGEDRNDDLFIQG